MTAAPPGTVIETIVDGAGNTCVATIHYDPSTGNFTTNPAISITNNGTVPAHLVGTNPNNGQTVTVTIQPGATQTATVNQLSHIGITNIGQLEAALGT